MTNMPYTVVWRVRQTTRGTRYATLPEAVDAVRRLWSPARRAMVFRNMPDGSRKQVRRFEAAPTLDDVRQAWSLMGTAELDTALGRMRNRGAHDDGVHDAMYGLGVAELQTRTDHGAA